MTEQDMNESVNDLGRLLAAARDVMVVDDVTEGAPPGNSVRLRGRLLLPSDEAYDRLAAAMRPLGRTPLLRKDAADQGGEGVEVLAMPVTFAQTRPRVGLSLILFTLTVLSCLFAGAQMIEGLEQINLNLLDGAPFALSLLAILTAHEFGHYLVARRLGSPTSLPYFLPLPFGPFGTLGAVITARVPFRNRRHLLAVGAAGPLAGLAAALPILLYGLSLSGVHPLPAGGYQMEGNSLLYAALKFLMFGKWLPSAGEDVFIHAVAYAGWAGLLVTGLNLMPAGQLDGGHIIYALFGARGVRTSTWIVLAALAALTFIWSGWGLWLALVFLFGRLHDRPLDEITELTHGQRRLALAMVAIFLLVFTPIPLTIVP
jgi:membrane-associated protease RseP (regulator of RpoE activity)